LLTKQEFESWIGEWDWTQSWLQVEVISKLQTKIVQGLFPRKDFPLLNESYDAGLLTNRQYDQKIIKKQTLREKLMINFDKSEYTLKYQNHIVKIINILDDLSLPLHKPPIPISDWALTRFDEMEGIFKQGKVYLELGKFAGTYHGDNVNKFLQFELLFITHEEWDEEAQQSEMRYGGVSLNPNKLSQHPQFRSRFPWEYYISSGVEENNSALLHVYELTYEVYVELMRQLNAPFNVSLNYPGGNF
jgi:hypothetical protein